MPSFKRVIEASNTNPPFLGFKLKDGSRAVIVAKDNGAATPAYFGAVRGGTVMGKITASSKWRPCAKQIVDDAQSSVNTLEMQSVKHFEVGDTVAIYDVSAGSILSGASNRNITAIDASASPPTITIDGAAVTVQVGDYVYNNDGSGVGRGVLDEEGVSTLAGQDINGLARYEDAEGRVITRGIVDEDLLDAVNDLNTHIIADLINAANGVHFVIE